MLTTYISTIYGDFLNVKCSEDVNKHATNSLLLVRAASSEILVDKLLNEEQRFRWTYRIQTHLFSYANDNLQWWS